MRALAPGARWRWRCSRRRRSRTRRSRRPCRSAARSSTRRPAQVVFRFDEAVEASFGALRVFDSEGQEVQTGKAFHPGGKGAEIAVKLRPGLGDGTYTATYRVVSADGHAVSSGFVFTVGEASAPSESLDQLLAGGGTGSVTNTALSVARGFQYAAIALGLGALIFLLVVLAPARRRLARVHRPPGARDPAVAAVAGLALGRRRGRAAGRRRPGRHVLGRREAERGERGARHPLRPRLGPRRAGLGCSCSPRWRRGRCAPAARSPAPPPAPEPVLVGAGPPTTAVAPAATAPRRARRRPAARRPRRPAVRARAAALVRRPHERAEAGRGAAAREHRARAGDERVARRDRGARARAAGRHRGARAGGADAAAGRPSSARFSALATIALPVLLLSRRRAGDRRGRQLRRAARQRVRPRGDDQDRGRARHRRPRLRQPPAAAAGAAHGATHARAHRRAAAAHAALRARARPDGDRRSPARCPATRRRSPSPPGPYATTVNVGPARLEVTVDPARVGPNQLHLYLFDRKTGAAFEGTKELRATAAMPSKQIAPITLSPHVAGPGHYVVDGAALAVAGRLDDLDRRSASPTSTSTRPASPSRSSEKSNAQNRPRRRRAIALAVPAAAQAHVTLQPNTAAAGAFTRLDVRVPNERDDASTTKVEVQFPDGFASASYEPVPGWDVKVTKEHAGARRSRPTTARSPRASTRSRGPPTATTDAIPPGALPGLRPLGPDPRQGRRQADLQGAADLHRRRGRALDRRRGLRQPGADRDRDRGGRGRPRRVARRRTPRRPRRPRRAHGRDGGHADRRRRRQRARDRRADRRRARPDRRRWPACSPRAAAPNGRCA